MVDLTFQNATPLFGVPSSAAPQQPQPVAPPAPVAPAGPQALPPMGRPRRSGIIDDSLGFLGDFLLSRLRMGTPYRDAKKNEELNLASQGFEQNPEEAFRRMASVDFNAATRFRDQYIDNQRLAAQNASTAESRDARLQLAQVAQADRTRGRVGSMLGSMATWDEGRRRAGYPQMRAQAIAQGQANGVDLSSELPESYDPMALDAFIDQSVPVGMQRQQRLTAERNRVTANQGEQRMDVTRDVAGQRISASRDIAERRIRAAASLAERRNQASVARAAQRDATTRRGQDLSSQRGSSRRAPPALARPPGVRVPPVLGSAFGESLGRAR